MRLQTLQLTTSTTVTQKVQLTYKLFLLETARSALNKGVDNFINKAYEEVHDFLNSSFPTSAFRDISETLDAKCQAIDSVTAFLNNLKLTPHVQNVDRSNTKMNLNQPHKEGTVWRFGPVLKNVLKESSVGKAVQVLEANLRFKNIAIPQPPEVQEKDVICSVSSRDLLKEAQQVGAFVEERSSRSAADGHSVETNAQEPLLLPPIPAVPPSCSYSEEMTRIQVTKWGGEDDIQVPHQKQTSSQLLHFLKVNAKNTGTLNVTVLQWDNSFLGLPPSRDIKRRSYEFKQDPATCPSGLLRDTETYQAPIFKLKGVDSSGFMTYTCVIASKTELWDIGDVVKESDRTESSSVASDENVTGQVRASEDTVQWIDGTSTKTTAVNVITIPEFQKRRFEEIEVVVSHMVNPGSFYIQYADASEKLQRLVKDTWKERRSYAEQKSIPDIGANVMGWFPQQQQWCRSQVTKICGVSKDNVTGSSEMSIDVEVRRLDYGDSICLSLSNIKELTSEMAVLPIQAVHVSLAHVSPVNGRDWSEEAVGWFRAMVHNRTLYARLYPQGCRVTVELFLEKGKIEAMRRSASLSLRLTQNGHAKHDKLKNGTVQLKMKKKNLEWEKDLISCYIQNHLHNTLFM